MLFFCFQAEDGIRDTSVTGVQTCALPIYFAACGSFPPRNRPSVPHSRPTRPATQSGRLKAMTGERLSKSRFKIGRASCRERLCTYEATPSAAKGHVKRATTDEQAAPRCEE